MNQLSDMLDATNKAAPKSVAEQAYRLLRADIIWGKLEPGAPLRSDVLRKRYDVGISPLREALSRLATERLVTSSSQRGFRVAPIDKPTIIDISETRLLIECQALTRSIERGDVDWETRVVSTHHALSRVPVPTAPGPIADEWAMRHRDFHMALLSACGSDWMMYLSGLLFDQAERFRIVRAVKPQQANTVRDPAKEHQEIVEAVLARDAERAKSALSQHYQATTDIVLADLE